MFASIQYLRMLNTSLIDCETVIDFVIDTEYPMTCIHDVTSDDSLHTSFHCCSQGPTPFDRPSQTQA